MPPVPSVRARSASFTWSRRSGGRVRSNTSILRRVHSASTLSACPISTTLKLPMRHLVVSWATSRVPHPLQGWGDRLKP